MNKLPSIKTFEKQLAIIHPWKIDDISFKPAENNKQELHVFLSFAQGSIFKDTTGTPCPIHSTYNKTWQHIDFEKQRCYLHCKIPLIKTTEGTILMLAVPWARTGSRFSWSFEFHVMQEIKKGTSLDAVGALFGKTSPRIWTIFNGWINTTYEADIVDQGISAIGIDEISDQTKGQQVTITIDLKKERVIRVTQHIGKEALLDLRSYLESKGIPPEQIKHVSGPLHKIKESPRFSVFCEDVKACFPNAEYHVDRLYIVKFLNSAMDQIRKKETKGTQETKDLTKHRTLFVKHPTLLSEEQKKEVQKLSALFPNVGKAYELKNAFFALCDQSSTQAAEAFLESWCHEVGKTKLSPLKHVAELLKTHKHHIVRFSDLPTDSSVMEKIHENILTATKRNKGLKNFENVSNMILFCCGKLQLPYIES